MSEIRLKCDKCKEYYDNDVVWCICDGCYEDPKNTIDEFLEDLKKHECHCCIENKDIIPLIKKWEEKKHKI